MSVNIRKDGRLKKVAGLLPGSLATFDKDQFELVGTEKKFSLKEWILNKINKVDDITERLSEVEIDVAYGANLVGNETNVYYPCKLKKGDVITIAHNAQSSESASFRVYFADGSKKEVDSWNIRPIDVPRTITIEADSEYIYLPNIPSDMTKIQINRGNKFNGYQEYRQNNPLVNSKGLEQITKETDNLSTLVGRKANIIEMDGKSNSWEVSNFPVTFYRAPIIFIGTHQAGATYIGIINANGTSVKLTSIKGLEDATISLTDGKLVISIETSNIWGTGALIY